MQDFLSISVQSNGDSAHGKTYSEHENGENMLDMSIMVDPRKAAGYKIPLDDFMVDN